MSVWGVSLSTSQADVRAYAIDPKNLKPSMEQVQPVMMSLTFNSDMGIVAGSIDFGTQGRINIEGAPLPSNYKEEPFTIDAFYQVLGGVANPLPNQPNAKLIVLFIDSNTVIGSFTAGKQHDMTGSFVLKLK